MKDSVLTFKFAYRIEGNVTIIAACVPILQRLWDRLLGSDTDFRHSSRPLGNYQQHDNYSEQSAPNAATRDIELSSPKTSGRRMKRKIEDLSCAMEARHDDSDDSEGGIVGPHPKVKRSSGDNISREVSVGEERIVKTQTITVTYDHGEGGPTAASKRWAPV